MGVKFEGEEKGERIERGGGEDGGRVEGERGVGRCGVCFSDGEKRWLVLSRLGQGNPILLAGRPARDLRRSTCRNTVSGESEYDLVQIEH